ncbi:MAG: thiol peroxidase [Parachlamydiales bacterium]|nr:thiol peroxidase [Parachlamydiales bacterium]
MLKVTFKKNPITLVGRNIKLLTKAPDFKVVSKDLKEFTFENFQNKIKLITFFPSLDTSVCDLQVKEFNKRAASISKDVSVIGISKDLPFAQKRFCESFNINNISVFSDYKTSSFGINFGVLIKELNLLARGALILDKNNVIRYIKIVEEVTDSINYDDVLTKLKEVAESKQVILKDLEIPIKCIPCEGKIEPLSKNKIEAMFKNLQNWKLIEDKKIIKEFIFKDFQEAKYFVDLIAIIAQEQGHHPNISIKYNKIEIALTTHAAEGLTENDFIMANIIQALRN